ncbi:phosphatase PAP2 family protein [Streptomyces sp. NBC_01537]|uniref:phosphatase PAP2 family protein n=1 Tax=Streptomyces sp. NBC_01537 TaxID=2903896 RepID=UPI003870B21F
MTDTMERSTNNRTSGINRRKFLTFGAAATALAAGPAWLLTPRALAAAATSTTTSAVLPFVDHYTTNVTANLTTDTNAAVEILSGFQKIWQTGTAWNTGTVLAPETLRANVRYSVKITTTRTDAEGRKAFIYDRQHQSYAAIEGLGPLAGLYKTGAKAVTGITSAPDTTPATTINDAIPADAPAGSALGPGSPTSDLGQVATLVNTLRGNYASGNPSKYAFQYPRPWRMTENSEVVDTGTVDSLGFPVYESDVVVVPQLLRQRSTSPTDDGGFVSGHTNAFWLASLAYAYAVPERFQELVASAFALSHTRIVAGMHNSVDVIGGRILATALAAATLSDPANATLKAAARAQAAAYFQAATGTTADTLYAYAHSAGSATDPYADREANAAAVAPRQTYVLPRKGRSADMTVPKGAEVLLETRQPYLSADQRREVLRTTALPAGYVLTDGPEQWGRLNLFAAADAYGSFDADVTVTLDASAGGFAAADAWRNDIDGCGALTKLGTGTLTLTGHNEYAGGTTIAAGTLVAGSARALGAGDIAVKGGTLRVEDKLYARASYAQASGAVLDIAVSGHGDHDAPLSVDRNVVLAKGSVLAIRLTDGLKPGRALPVIDARRLQGQFASITVDADGYKAVPVYTAKGLSVRIVKG